MVDVDWFLVCLSMLTGAWLADVDSLPVDKRLTLRATEWFKPTSRGKAESIKVLSILFAPKDACMGDSPLEVTQGSSFGSS